MSVSIWSVNPDDPNTGVIWNGTGDPNLVTDFGNYGDFYIDVATWQIYGPKSSTGWGIGVNMIGGTGIKGTQGATGPIGPQGTQGPKGDKGDTGPAGPTGSSGANGTNGAKILTGITDPADGDGTTGDFYINTANGDLWGPNDQITLWGDDPVGNIMGPPGTSTFLSLTDVPHSYTGQAGKYLRVASGESALEFIEPPARMVISGDLSTSGSSISLDLSSNVRIILAYLSASYIQAIITAISASETIDFRAVSIFNDTSDPPQIESATYDNYTLTTSGLIFDGAFANNSKETTRCQVRLANGDVWTVEAMVSNGGIRSSLRAEKW